MFKSIKKVVAIALLAVAAIVPMTSCGSSEMIDYVSQTKIVSTNWKTSNYRETGVGIVTLKKNVDGDTAHFYAGSTSYVIQGRFNGVDTPESTGVIEPWGKKAAAFTADILNKAQTIVLETEPNNEKKGPEADSTDNRYLVWVWTSERPAEEEDGTQLRLLNLDLVQNGLSPSKGTSDSIYNNVFLDADAQAQKHKLYYWSKDPDPDFYNGAATITSLQEIFSNPQDHIGEKVYLEGYVTRTMGTDAYIQDEFEEEDGSYKMYGCYIFTMYKDYSILRKGNHIGVTGKVAEYNGSYQLVDVKYNSQQAVTDGMVDLGGTLTSEEVNERFMQTITVDEANNGVGMGTLIKINNLRATGGYGGNDEKDKNGVNYEKNSMTIYVRDENNREFQIRIDDKTSIRDKDGMKIKSYTYFVNLSKNGVTFDFAGLMGRYESEFTGEVELQLMLVVTSDITYHGLE